MYSALTHFRIIKVVVAIFLIKIVVTIFLLFMPAKSMACRCVEQSYTDNYQAADMVFHANVTEFMPDLTGEGGLAFLKVKLWWKVKNPIMKKNKDLIVGTRTNCAFDFKMGETYLVFIKEDQNGLYYTNRCMGNKPSDFFTLNHRD